LQHWEEYTELPELTPDYTLMGLDFGQVDPNALVEVNVYGNNAYIKEHLYKSDMTNQELVEVINEAITPERQGEVYVVADSAAKSNIKEIKKLGVYVIPCKKGAGSIEGGLQKMKSMNIFVHKESNNLKYELNHYFYIFKVNMLGERKVVPIDKDNHLIDAARYSLNIY